MISARQREEGSRTLYFSVSFPDLCAQVLDLFG